MMSPMSSQFNQPGDPTLCLSIDGVSLPASQWVEHLGPLLTSHRRERIAEVIQNRTQTVIPVLEGIYDRGNISAVMRSAEAFGLYEMHIIELSEKFKVSARVSKGADKWLNVQRHSRPRHVYRG